MTIWFVSIFVVIISFLIGYLIGKTPFVDDGVFIINDGLSDDQNNYENEWIIVIKHKAEVLYNKKYIRLKIKKEDKGVV